jgi:phage tail sheath protein FI
LSDSLDRGITVTEIATMDQPIDIAPETTAAFVGRALRGPLNTPVLIHAFGEFRRRFGDIWSRSSLGPAVEQFFEHGGQNLFIVRVANNARGAMVCLPASGSALVLRAMEPGSTERVRASVDYDGIDDENDELFNLTLQRVDPTSGILVDQEIFRRLSFDESSETFVADILLSSTMVKVEHPYPSHRPDLTSNSDSRYDLSWVGHAQDGTDGVEHSDYDLIGSREDATGIFSLQQTEHFDLLYLPPIGKSADTGPAAILAAEIYCRQRGAMLVVDPPAEWQSSTDVLQGVRNFGYASPNMVSYYPRIRMRGDADDVRRVAGAALAGLLCKLDDKFGPWQSLEHESLGFKRGIKPLCDLGEEERYALHRAGINVIESGAAGRSFVNGSMTMARGSESYRVFKSLSVRRLCLRIIGTIDRSTRWAVFEKPDMKLTERIRRQIMNYFFSLAELGAFANERYVVECDAGLCKREDRLEHGVTIMLVFHPIGSAEPTSFTLHQTVAGFRVASSAFAPVARDCA